MTSHCYSERELWVWLLPPIVILSEAKDQREILRFTQDDKAVLPVALWPTRAHARLRLMRIEADKSAMGAINRPLRFIDLLEHLRGDPTILDYPGTSSLIYQLAFG